jgi:hypothetical protein
MAARIDAWKTKTTPPVQPKKDSQDKYCYTHGLCAHSSKECRTPGLLTMSKQQRATPWVELRRSAEQSEIDGAG